MRSWLQFIFLLVALSASAMTARPTGYGAVPGYRPLALAHGGDLAQSSAWRGRWPDITGYYNIGRRTYDPVAGMWLSYDSVWNDADPNYLSFAGGDPINGFDSDGRMTAGFYAGLTGEDVSADASSAFMSGYYGGGVSGAFGGQLLDEAQAANSPSTYINGAESFANNVDTVYQDGGLVDASSYALTSWNMGAVMSGIANQNQVTGQPLGDWMQQAEAISGGVAGTAGVASFGLGLWNAATAPASTAIAATAEESTVAAGQTGNTVGLLQAPPEPAGLLPAPQQPAGLLPQYAESLSENGADTVTPGSEISTYRQTTAGETYLRYESGNPDYTQITSEGGVLPQTYAATASEGVVPQGELGVQYNLPNPQIPRQVYYQLEPPEGTWIVGPRPVAGGPGNEVLFPYGSAPGTATGPFPTPTP